MINWDVYIILGIVRSYAYQVCFTHCVLLYGFTGKGTEKRGNSERANGLAYSGASG